MMKRQAQLENNEREQEDDVDIRQRKGERVKLWYDEVRGRLQRKHHNFIDYKIYDKWIFTTYTEFRFARLIKLSV